MAHHRPSSFASRCLALAGILALAASTLAPAAHAQSIEAAPRPSPGALLSLANDIYPRATAEVELASGLKVRPIKTLTTKSGKQVVADRLIVAFARSSSDADVADAHQKAAARGGLAGKAVKQLGPTTQLVDVSGAKSIEAAVAAYTADPRVRFAAPDSLIRPTETPNDTRFGEQWNMTKIQAPQAWNRSHDSSARRIAILDTGIDETHADLAGRVVARADFGGSASGTADMIGHGTHVAGIAAAVTNNARGVAGVAWETRLLNAKVMDDTGSGSLSMLIDAIRWATANGAEVINMSLASDSGEDCNPSVWEDLFDTGVNELQDAIDEAWAANVVLVGAAGNSGNSNQLFPAACNNVLSVANTTSTDARAGDSNFGTWVDVAAPGSNILSTVPGGGFDTKSGTSMASPHVAGLAALVKTSCGFTTASNIVSRIENTADAIAGTGASWVFGRINALRAVCFPAPSNLHLGTISTSSIEILWNDGGAPADSSTEVHFRPHNAATWTIQVLAANRTSWLHQGLASGAGFDYKVRDCDANGCSAFTNMVTGFVGTTTFALTVSRTGSGSVVSTPAGISCGSDCSDVYPSGRVVTLEARDGSIGGVEWVFTGWGGACSGGQYTCTVTMNAARNVTAHFTRTSESGPLGP